MTEMKPPYLTLEDVEREISAEAFYQFPGTSVTICCLTFSNGAHAVGKSMCINPANFNEEVGRTCSRGDAIHSATQMMAYAVLEAMKPTPVIPHIPYAEPTITPENIHHIRWIDGGCDLAEAVQTLAGTS